MTGRAPRLRKRELFRALGYQPHPGQVEVHRSTASRRVLACGARWGKSTCATMESIAALMEPRESSTGWIVAPSYDLCERIYRQVEGIVTTRFEHRVVESRPRERLLVIRNLSGGLSEVRAKSADNPTSLLGEGLDWLVVDEAARLREDVWSNYLSQRLLDKGGWALVLSTPRAANWFYSLFMAAESDDDYQAWQQPSSRNPLLDEAMLEGERRRLSEATFAQEYEAVFLGAESVPCAACGCPDPAVPGIVIVRSDGVIDTCPACGEQVDEDGHTLLTRGADGKPALTQIVLEPLDEVVQPPLMEAET